MGNPPLNFLAEIPDTDWERTPVSVKGLVGQLVERIAALEERQQHLEEQLQRNSQNSSQPPSQDGLQGFKPKPKAQDKKKRGGQPGHEGHSQKLYAPEECAAVEEHYPSHCCACGAVLSGFDAAPQRYQIVELPSLRPLVLEHRFHALACSRCGMSTRADARDVVNGSRYGDRLCALVGLLSGEYRQSHRMVVRLLAEIFEVEMAVGSVGRLRQTISDAVAMPVAEVHEYVQHQGQVSVDETSFQQGNADGANPTGMKGWLWVVVTPLVCYFQVLLSRSHVAAQTILGSTFVGYVNSDRYSAYTWLALEQRQLCWAHLKRDFTKIAERSGVSRELGEALLHQHKQLFALWHRVRDGTLERTQLSTAAEPIRQAVHQRLTEAAADTIADNEKTPWAKTVRTCRQLLKVEPALWLFVTVEGIEPTNNAAEQAIRPAVLWRKCSYGAQSAQGSLFVGRIMTVVTSLRRQQRHVLDYLSEACRAKRQGLPAPSLLPISTSANSLPVP
jgi:transposase